MNVIDSVRKASVADIALEVISVQPLSAPAGQIFTLRARYDREPPTGCWFLRQAIYKGKTPVSCTTYPYYVDLPNTDRSVEIKKWAFEHIKKRHNYFGHWYVNDKGFKERHVWRWGFDDASEAMLFKMTWMEGT